MVDMKKKLQSRSGETLSEALISVLIVSLASVMLATMISAASSMNMRTKNYDESLDKAVVAMTAGTPKQGKVIVKVDSVQIGDGIDVDVKSYSGDNNISLSSYALPKDSEQDPVE